MTSSTVENMTLPGGCTSKKRERNEVFDESYVKNKRILQEGFKSLTLIEPEAKSSLIDMPSYALNELRNKCPVHELFHSDLECHCDPNFIRTEIDMDEASDDLSEDAIEKKLSVDSFVSRSTESEEANFLEPNEEHDFMLSLVKGGKRKYIRKVDYLVDELIRKTRKTNNVPIYCTDHDAILPPNVGPSPRTDQAISVLVPVPTNSCSLSHSQYGPPLLEYPTVESPSQPPILLSGEVTHSDWGIEEVHDSAKKSVEGSQCTAIVPYMGKIVDSSSKAIDVSDDIDNNSNMAYCEDSSLHYSSNCSVKSHSSDMMVDSDDDEILASCGRFVGGGDNSTNFVETFAQGKTFLGNASTNAVGSRLAIPDDEEENIMNIGTF